MRPGVRSARRPGGTTAASAVKPRSTGGRQRMASAVVLTSRASIFLPTYSGVRPTMSPARNIATMANNSIP